MYYNHERGFFCNFDSESDKVKFNHVILKWLKYLKAYNIAIVEVLTHLLFTLNKANAVIRGQSIVIGFKILRNFPFFGFFLPHFSYSWTFRSQNQLFKITLRTVSLLVESYEMFKCCNECMFFPSKKAHWYFKTKEQISFKISAMQYLLHSSSSCTN